MKTKKKPSPWKPGQPLLCLDVIAIDRDMSKRKVKLFTKAVVDMFPEYKLVNLTFKNL